MQEFDYLISADLSTVPELRCDTLVVGSGIAGLSAALAAAEGGGRVILVSKEKLPESATMYAQGGIAAAIAPGDTPENHVADTLVAGQGLCDEEAVRVLATEGARLCAELVEAGAPFDRTAGELHFTMEGAHSRRRILHADGDATGRVLQQYLQGRIQDNEDVTVYENHFVIDLLHSDGECFGALLLDTSYGRLLVVRANATILCSGGAGQVFRETTNPPCATGDGCALAFRAGAVLRDMEFIQFHPTTLYLAGAPRFLISESVRGEGAKLLNHTGESFMERYDPRGGLAPRDIVSQSIMRELHQSGGATCVYLDLRHIGRQKVLERFPNIARICSLYGLDITADLIPVRPAAHYFMGGIKTDLWGRTGVDRLFAAGECASTGVHGANRLASNSLLEGLVFGERAGRTARELRKTGKVRIQMRRQTAPVMAPLDLNDMLQSLKALCWRNLGIFRNGPQLQEAEKTIAFWSRYVLVEQFRARGGFELQNMLTFARVAARSALLREESRGAHQREDFPEELPVKFHTEINRGSFC